jgi:archaellum biogenesis ATPase FlaH
MIEQLIFSNLIFNETYARKSLPFLKDDYFQSRTDKTLFNLVSDYVEKYNSLPTKEALAIEISNVKGLSDDEVKLLKQQVTDVSEDKTDIEWLYDQTEKFCQDKAVYNAVMDSINILDGKGGQDKGAIPDILSKALAVSFDTHIGHDFLEDSDERYEFYHRKESRLPFDLDYFNLITKGGLPKKTLNIALAGTGVGKSLFMCHCAAANLSQGSNVLYITMEMAEEKIAERIDANLLNEAIDMLSMLPKDVYDKKIERIKSKTPGKLIIKEYPTASAGSNHFRHLLNELKLKRNFKPDIIYIDYLNICMSSRLKFGANVNSYTYVKSIAEELRGLAVEFNVPIVSATQTTRSGYSNTDVGLEDTSESFGLPATADLMFALITSEELEGLGQIMVKQLKNRYNDPFFHRKFVVGIDKSKMKLYNVEQSAQDDISDDKPLFDSTDTGNRLKAENKKFNKDVFSGFQ